MKESASRPLQIIQAFHIDGRQQVGIAAVLPNVHQDLVNLLLRPVPAHISPLVLEINLGTSGQRQMILAMNLRPATRPKFDDAFL